MPETKLLPCPFCGLTPSIKTSYFTHTLHHSCKAIKINIGRVKNKYELIETWNIREGQKDLVWLTRAEVKNLQAFPDLIEVCQGLEFWWRLPSTNRTIRAIEPVIRAALDVMEMLKK